MFFLDKFKEDYRVRFPFLFLYLHRDGRIYTFFPSFFLQSQHPDEKPKVKDLSRMAGQVCSAIDKWHQQQAEK